jgi:hypothetical protein
MRKWWCLWRRRTTDADWDPTVLDHTLDDDDTFFDTIAVANDATSEMPNIDHIIDNCIMHRNIGLYEAHAREVKTKESVYYKLDDSTFPSESSENLGRFVDIAEHVGHFMTFKILTEDTKKIIFRSNVRSALDPTAKNLRLDTISGETSIPVTIKSRRDSDSRENEKYQHTPMPVFQNPVAIGPAQRGIQPSDLVDKAFLMDPQEDQQYR